MKINYNNTDLKIINCNRLYGCSSCELNSILHLCRCSLLCRSDKIWIKDIFNSDIFRL